MRDSLAGWVPRSQVASPGYNNALCDTSFFTSEQVLVAAGGGPSATSCVNICFPGDAQVLLRDSTYLAVSQLKLGDEVRGVSMFCCSDVCVNVRQHDSDSTLPIGRQHTLPAAQHTLACRNSCKTCSWCTCSCRWLCVVLTAVLATSLCMPLATRTQPLQHNSPSCTWPSLMVAKQQSRCVCCMVGRHYLVCVLPLPSFLSVALR